MTHGSEAARTPALVWVLAAILMLWIVVVVTLSQWQMSPTYDEQNHVTRGIAILRTGDYRLVSITRRWRISWKRCRWPGGRNGFSTDMPAWDGDNLSIWEAARTTVWSIPRDGCEDHPAGAHPGAAVHPGAGAADLPLGASALRALGRRAVADACSPSTRPCSRTAGWPPPIWRRPAPSLLAMYLLRRYLQRPSRGRLLLAGVGLGLALAAKFSALILLPIIGLVLLMLASGRRRTDVAFLPAGRQCAGAALPACRGRRMRAACCWRARHCRLGGLWLQGRVAGQQTGTAAAGDRLAGWTASRFPRMQYLRGVEDGEDRRRRSIAPICSGKSDTTGKGWWYYFPVAMATKTPMPELLAMLGMLCCWRCRRARARWVLRRGELLLAAAAGRRLLPGGAGVARHLAEPGHPAYYADLSLPAVSWPAGGPCCRFAHAITRPALVCLLAMQLASVMFALSQLHRVFQRVPADNRQGYRILSRLELRLGAGPGTPGGVSTPR